MNKRMILTGVAALALVGLATAANAHEGYNCRAKESGSYFGAANTSHGRATQLGKTASQGRFEWDFSEAGENEGCGVLVAGLSVTRAANGDLVFVQYDDGTNCPNDDGTATADVTGVVTGGTGRFALAGGQGVHTISIIHVTSFPAFGDFDFGGTETRSHNECLLDD